MTETQISVYTLNAMAVGKNTDPFAVLGPHLAGKNILVRCFQPNAVSVELVDSKGELLTKMSKIHGDGIFQAELSPKASQHTLVYRFRLCYADGTQQTIDDPYRFKSALGDVDLHLFGEGSHHKLYKKLGAHIITVDGVVGTHFAVWAPNAMRVSVIGDFNDWDGRVHVMRLHRGNGIWDIFIPAVQQGAKYKFELLDAQGKLLPLKSDPLAHYFEPPPGNASIVYETAFEWSDKEWMQQRSSTPDLEQAISVYEVHLGSWRRKTDEHNRINGRSLTYTELADELISYVLKTGFTHIELLPVTEHPFDGSWGYQPIGMYAPTQRFGDPDEFRYFVNACHCAGIGVIIDWVPAHFPRDEHGLVQFDGTALYEHADPRRGEHSDWGTLIFNYGRREVCNYLIANALFWIDEFHLDGLRVDAVASMLYLDYSREPGKWLPNEHGGNENLEAVAFLRQLNEVIHSHGAITFAEESTSWPGVSRPTYANGLGFTYKWNMGWMNDTLKYMSEDPLHRKYHHDKLTFGLVYAFSENFILPLSHDEVVHGKHSILGRMPGDEWQRFANLRAYYGYMFAHPGKKLLFMGDEFAQSSEWNHDKSLDWHLLEFPLHQGMQKLVSDLNRLYQQTLALHQVDFEPEGFEWIDLHGRDDSIVAWIRHARNGESVICVTNFTPVVRHNYHLGVSASGNYRELINTDAFSYGGSGITNSELVKSTHVSAHGRPNSVILSLPPLATVILEQAR